jgi:hypothetical protein
VAPFDVSPKTTMGLPAILALSAVQAALVAAVAITGASLWIDELSTWILADVGSFSSWLKRYLAWTDSDGQMPLYQAYVFLWGQAFGLSEYSMRLANWPLFIAAEGVFLWTFRRVPLFALMFWALSSFHPLLWYYLNEARPYVMAYAGATVMLCGLVGLYAAGAPRAPAQAPMSVTCAVRLFVGGTVVLTGSTLLGVPWAGCGVLAAVYLAATRCGGLRRALRGAPVAWGLLAALLAGLAVFYAGTLTRGARATDLFATDLRTLIFSAYELMGLSGLGPGRLELRAAGAEALDEWLLPIVLGGAIIGACLWFGWRALVSCLGARGAFVAAAVACFPAAFIAFAGVFLHWRVVGRHFIPFLPLILSVLALGASALIDNSSSVAKKTLAVALLVTFVISAGNMHSERHAKDDYRAAAALAGQSLRAGEVVWWAAYGAGGRYYGLDVSDGLERAQACPSVPKGNESLIIDISNVGPDCLVALPGPDLVVLSKTDIFDKSGAIRRWIASSGFTESRTLAAFTLWRRPPP